MIQTVLLILCITSLLLPASPADAAGLFFWQKAQLEIPHKDLLNLSTDQQIVIKGFNPSSENRILVLRVDDRPSPNFANRVNLERTVPPGHFTFRFNLGGLYTSNHRTINLNKIQQIITFQGDESSDLQLHSLEIVQAANLTEESIAWDFGPVHSALMPGFKQISIDHPFVIGPFLSEVSPNQHSQAYDALTHDGIKGLTKLKVPLAKGRWYITLWLDEPGEWEFMPHPLHKEILANKQTVYQLKHSADSWVKQVYLAGQVAEVSPSKTPWQLYANRKNGQVSFPITVGDRGLTLEFTGEQPNGSFISALLAEKSSSYQDKQNVAAQRERWWNETWRVQPWPSVKDRPSNQLSKPAYAGKQTFLWLTVPSKMAQQGFSYQLNKFEAATKIKTIQPSLSETENSISSSIRYGLWQYERPELSATLLSPAPSRLVSANNDTVPATKAPYRQLLISVNLPKTITAGDYTAQLILSSLDKHKSYALSVQVLDIPLSKPNIPIGVYLEKPVHFDWFESFKSKQIESFKCDLKQLQQLGFSSVAPPFTTPKDEKALNLLLIEADLLRQTGFKQSLLAYSPFKRLQTAQGLDQAAHQVQKTDQLLNQLGYAPIIWSIADEPSNAGQDQSPSAIARYIKSYSPNTLLAGHLNNPKDMALIDVFDIALINSGFGADKSHIELLNEKGIEPWFYNLGSQRIFSGFYLWKTEAKGFMQWHARMPTVDPFNPTDGREGDAQLLYPSYESCPQTPSINRDLIHLAEGILDYQLISALAVQAVTNPRLVTLLNRIENQIPEEYVLAKEVTEERLEEWRQLIVNALTNIRDN